MIAPSPTAAKRPGRPRWQLLLRQTLRRMRFATASRRGLWIFLVLAALYGVFFLTVRLTGLLRLRPEPLALLALPLVAAIIGGLLPRKPTLRDAARAVDQHARTNDLFLTMFLLDGSAGEFQPLVAAMAETKAATIRPRDVVPMGLNRRLSILASALVAFVALVHLVPQLDPFGKVNAAQQAENETRKLNESKKQTKERMAQIERENLSDNESKEVKQELDKLKLGLKSARPKEKQSNAKMLAESQKGIADQWRKISADKLKDLMSQSPLSQQFGSSSAATKKWLEDLQAGSTESLKKEMSEMQRDLEELSKTKDPVKQAQLKKRIRERLDALAEFAKDQAGSKTLAAALKRTQEQMRMAAKAEDDPAASQEAMKAAAESMKLAEKELEQMAQSVKDLKELEKALAALQKAKQLNNAESLDGEKMVGAQTMEEYEAMFSKMMRDTDVEGFGDDGERPEEKADSKFKTEISKSHITKGKVLLTLKTKGMGEKVDVKDKYRAAIRDVKQSVSEAILQEEIPPGYHEGIKGYFDTLEETPAVK